MIKCCACPDTAEDKTEAKSLDWTVKLKVWTCWACGLEESDE